MSALTRMLRIPNTAASIGVPAWFDDAAVDEFVGAGPVTVTGDRACHVGFSLAPEHPTATCFVAIPDGHGTPDWVAAAVTEAASAAGARGAKRFEAWVPAWNDAIARAAERSMTREGLLEKAVFAYGERWDLTLYSVQDGGR
ncbi:MULTISPECIES: hypothetical protein [Microbacterium]|uniref:hypothetical protein n=1 Tax=Microbacterium TaxID=33882 RepID=UPI000FF2A31B|nr:MULTISPECIES: hypothetical protein [Microbacterium]MDF2560623.1 hypothetical protein [Microbacterium sp.]RKE63609.1 hypothetical protein DEU36_0820 [Microbacterium sp. AG238]WJM16762.1 hypothetical protein QUC20_05470 [Microbacterium arborescens]